MKSEILHWARKYDKFRHRIWSCDLLCDHCCQHSSNLWFGWIRRKV